MHFTLITLFDQEMERSTFKNWSFPKCFYSFIYIEQFNKNTQYNDKSICLGELTERSVVSHLFEPLLHSGRSGLVFADVVGFLSASVQHRLLPH